MQARLASVSTNFTAVGKWWPCMGQHFQGPEDGRVGEVTDLTFGVCVCCTLCRCSQWWDKAIGQSDVVSEFFNFLICSHRGQLIHDSFSGNAESDHFIYFHRKIPLTSSFSPYFSAPPWLVQALAVCNCIVCWYDLVTQSQRHWHCGCGLHGHVRGIKSAPRAAAHNIFMLGPLEQEVLS